MSAELPITRIAPSRPWQLPAIAELRHARELVRTLVWRDLTVRYRQTVIGVLWAMLQPVLTVGVFVAVFGRLAGDAPPGTPYALFALAGLVPWTFFSNGVTQGTGSMVHNQELIRRIYFPRAALPLAAVLAGTIELAIGLLLLIAGCAIFKGTGLPWTALLLPAFLALCFATTLGAALLLAALNARFRDVGYAVPFLLQLLLFLSPVAYATSVVSGRWQSLYMLNPMVGVIDGVRWSLFGGPLPWPSIAVSVGASLMLLLAGAVCMRRVERTLADRL